MASRAARILAMVNQKDNHVEKNIPAYAKINFANDSAHKKPAAKKRLTYSNENPNNFEEAICIPTVFQNKKERNKRKKNCCFYCNNLVCIITRHLETRHAKESDVQKMMSLPKGCSERKVIIDKIRKEGNFKYNQLNTSKISCRRSLDNKPRNDDKPCPICKGYFSKLTLRRHYRKCANSCIPGQRNTLVESRRMEGIIHKKACLILKNEIFPVMREDDVVKLIRQDELIIQYGNKMCSKYRSKHHHFMIRSRLRLIGRFLIEVMKLDNKILEFKSIFQPRHYDIVVEAVNKVGKLDESKGKYGAPSTAFALGTALKVNANILIFEYIKNENEVMQKITNDFLKLMQEDFSLAINKTVEENQQEAKRRQTIILPSTADIKKLINYLNNQRRTYYKYMIENEFFFCHWKMLASFTLISIQVFNRRRAGELERATIEDFNSHKKIDKDRSSDIFKNLSTKSQNAVNRYVRFLIRGKKNRIVPVLLHKELVECIELIIKYREQVGISNNNPYIFGLPGEGPEFKYLRAVKLLRDFSEECGASNPSALRGTQLRKQIATQSVLLNLEETEVEDLANFMGHSEKIHRKHYRIPIATREIANISRLLEMAQGEEEDTSTELSDEDTSNQEQPNQGNNEKSTSNHINLGTQFETIPTESKNTGNKRNRDSVIGVVKRNTWITPEKKMARSVFKNNIDMGVLPTYAECAEVVKNNPELGNRTAMQLKLWIYNQSKRKNGTPTKKGKRVIKTWTTPERHAAKKAFSKYISQEKLPTLIECSEAIAKFSPLKKRSATVVKGYVNNLINRQKKNKVSPP